MNGNDFSMNQVGSHSTPNAASGIAAGRRTPEPQTRVQWTLPGLCWNARVATSFGELPIQALRPRDPLRSEGGNLVQVAWTDKIHLDEDVLQSFPDAQPVLIRAGSLGPGRPRADILVSPHQRLNISASPYGTDFRPARELLGRPGIMRKPETMVTYHLFHCGTPMTISIEGVSMFFTP